MLKQSDVSPFPRRFLKRTSMTSVAPQYSIGCMIIQYASVGGLIHLFDLQDKTCRCTINFDTWKMSDMDNRAKSCGSSRARSQAKKQLVRECRKQWNYIQFV